jgi:hypothetical protein
MRTPSCDIDVSMSARFFSGASFSRSTSVGSSMFALRRSA